MHSKIQLWQENGRVLIRSKYSESHDLVLELYYQTNENAWLIEPDMAITDYNKGVLIHQGPDDFPASILGEYGTLSGNHASPFGRKLLIFDHRMGEKELGAIFTDPDGNEYCLMEIIDKDNLLIHPLPKGKAPYPEFAKFEGDRLFYQGRLIPVIVVTPVQLYPSNRITRKEFLVDGKQILPEKVLMTGNFLDHVFNYDVVSPEALIDMVKTNCGKAHHPQFTPNRCMVELAEFDGDPAYDTYRTLPALATYQITMRYDGFGACVTDRRTTVCQELASLDVLDVMSIWSGECALMPVQEFYIPHTKPCTLSSSDGRTVKMDFADIARFDRSFPASCMLAQEVSVSGSCQPDSFIRFAGKEGKRELGIALGYSLCNGLSAAPDWYKSRPEIYQFAPTWKMYPRIFKVKNIKPGWQVETVSYRQYFHPADPELTDFYWHYENDDLLVYIDTHRKLDGKEISLPVECKNLSMEIIRKSGSMSLERSVDAPLKLTLFTGEGNCRAVLRFSSEK